MWFGKHDADSFVGCLGDVTYNGKLLDFAKVALVFWNRKTIVLFFQISGRAQRSFFERMWLER